MISGELTMVTVCALQPHLRHASESLLDATSRVLALIDKASKEQEDAVDLYVLPELSPIGYSEDTFHNYLPTTSELQRVYQNIDEAFAATAIKRKAFISYGTIGWTHEEEGKLCFFIRQLVVNRSGSTVSCYDKIHLCDYGDCAETRFFQKGQHESPVFSINGLCFGTLICADMRFPCLSRSLVLNQQADVLLQPAAFSRDISFRTWRSFRETRAVENSVYFVAVTYAGMYYGESSIVPPWVDDDHEPLIMNQSEGYLIGQLKRSVLDHARTSMPFYRNMIKNESTACCHWARESRKHDSSDPERPSSGL